MAIRVALFDMDRTLVREHTGALYVKYQRNIGEISLFEAARATGWLLQYHLGIIDAEKVADAALASVKGMPESQMWARCRAWFRDYVEPHIAKRGQELVARHLANGDVVAIVSGASPYAAKPLSELLRIPHVVSSEFDVDPEGRFTGKFVPPLCYGPGKLTRTEALADRLEFGLEECVFYTDSHTDLPLLERVGERVIVNPDFRLRRIAKRRGWPIEQW